MDNIQVLKHESIQGDDRPTIYHYRECGLDNVWLVGGFSIDEEDGEACLFIEDQDKLHMAIALSIIHSGDRINGRELWFLRHELNLTQEHLARLLQSDVQAVARWEKGKARVPGPADRLIRFLYLERTQQNPDVCELLEILAELDRLTHAKTFFEKVPSGWQRQAA